MPLLCSFRRLCGVLLCVTASIAPAQDAVIRQYRGLTSPDPEAPFSLCGVWTINVAPNGSAFTGRLRLGSDVFALTGRFDENGIARFGEAGKTTRTLPRGERPSFILSFTRTAGASGNPRLNGAVQQTGSDRGASLTASAALYVAEQNPPAPFSTTPENLLGRYTVAFPPRTPAEQGLGAEEFPQGYGVGSLRVTASGQVTFAGRLADGATASCAGPITEGNTWAFYTALYEERGSAGGMALFRDQPSVSDFDATNLLWFRPRGLSPGRYPNGWAQGLKVNLAASKYIVPPESQNESVFPGLAAADADGNASLQLSAGALRDAQANDDDPKTPLIKAANITKGNRVTILKPGATRLTSILDPNTGKMRGTFVHNASGALTTYRAVILQKQQRAVGYFLGRPR